MVKVSVIIPAYNAEKYIHQCVSSVLEQSYQDFEVIVVNDGSTDSTRSIVEALALQDLRIKLINKKNSGRAKARNTGITLASGEWLAFLDADDYWKADKLEKQLEVACKEKTGVVYSLRVWVDQYGNEQVGDVLHTLPVGEIFEQLIEGNYLCTSTVMVKRAVVVAAGGFSEREEFRNCQDYDLWVRISILTTFSAVEEGLVFYRVHDSNAHKDYKHRYIGLRACMDRLREVLEKYKMESKLKLCEKINHRDAEICEMFGVKLFKIKEFKLAFEALSFARRYRTFSLKRRLIYFICKAFLVLEEKK